MTIPLATSGPVRAGSLRFGIVGAGFWAPFQLAAWREGGGVECIALCDAADGKAAALAAKTGVAAAYTDPAEMIDRERLDFLDIITSPATHAELVTLAAERGLAVICQKPMAPTLAEARMLTAECARRGTPFFVHENWRWQAPIRAVKAALDSGVTGRPFRARLDFCSSFPVFDNQPALKELERFILADMGSHLFDVARFLFGEVASVYCRTSRVRTDICGEDVATAVLAMRETGTDVVCNFSYASRTEHERFPETFILIEGERGAVELAPDYSVRVTTTAGTHARRVAPPFYPWADPRYALVHASMVACHANLLAALRGEAPAETTAADNLRTLEIVFAAYESAERGQAVILPTATPADPFS